MKYKNLNEKIHITLTDMQDYKDYENFLKQNKPLSYIKINNEKIQNNNIINFIL